MVHITFYKVIPSQSLPLVILRGVGAGRKRKRAEQMSLPSWEAVGSRVFSLACNGSVKVLSVVGYCYKENSQIVSKDKDLVDH